MGHRVGTLGHEYGSDEVVGRRSASGVCHPGVVRGGERARGGDADSRRYRIGPDDLDDPEAVVGAWGEIVAHELLARLPDDAGVGIDVGRRFADPPRPDGLRGDVVRHAARTVTIAMRYFALTMLHIDIKLFEGADDCLLELNADHLPPMYSGSSSNATPPDHRDDNQFRCG